MKKIMPSKSLLLDVTCMLLILLFVYAAVNKLMEFDRFKAQIGKSPLIMRYVDWVSWLVPSSEILISFILLLPKYRIIGLFLSYTLMLMFTLYIAFILTFSPYVPCSCGGILNNLGWTEHLIFNVAFTILALAGIVIIGKYETKGVTIPQNLNFDV